MDSVDNGLGRLGVLDVPVNKCENNVPDMALIGDFNATVYSI